MIRSTSFALTLSLSVGLANAAFDLNDCIINGMKGVSSDTAARQVRYACDQKNLSHKQQLQDELLKEFGEVLDTETLEKDKYFKVEEPGFNSIRYTNKSADKTVSFVRLEVVPAPGGPETLCDMSKRRVYAYKVTMKPHADVKLIYPSSATSNCLNALVVLGRPPSWKDVSFSSSAKPVDKDPFAGLE